MVVRNAKLGGSDWTSENPSSTDMNDTNDALAFRRIANDSSTYSTQASSATLLTTISVSAGAVERFIQILIDIANVYKYSSGNFGAEYYYIRVDIGVAGSEATKATYTDRQQDLYYDSQFPKTQSLYYEPTSTEKSSGFNIKIYGYLGSIQGSNASTAYAKITNVDVLGA